MTEPFIVKHYADDERPCIKGNGFDGLELCEDRQDAEDFAAWINAKLARLAVAERLLREAQEQLPPRNVCVRGLALELELGHLRRRISEFLERQK